MREELHDLVVYMTAFISCYIITCSWFNGM